MKNIKGLLLAIIVILLIVLLMGLAPQSNEVGRYEYIAKPFPEIPVAILDTETGIVYTYNLKDKAFKIHILNGEVTEMQVKGSILYPQHLRQDLPQSPKNNALRPPQAWQMPTCNKKHPFPP